MTLDALPPLNTGVGGWLQESPPGYGKVKLTGDLADTWEEFLTSTGYLCRYIREGFWKFEEISSACSYNCYKQPVTKVLLISFHLQSTLFLRAKTFDRRLNLYLKKNCCFTLYLVKNEVAFRRAHRKENWPSA